MKITFFVLQVIVIFFTLSIHEFSHALAAFLLGDNTAKEKGRLTLNPLSHLDIIGAIMLFVAKIGWAKPVPVNPYNFKNIKRDYAIVALAGPLSNFIMAIVLSLIFNFLKYQNQNNIFFLYAFYLIRYTIIINLGLGLFNLIPIPPLDGSKILGGFLSYKNFYHYALNDRKGIQIFVAVLLVSYIFKLSIIERIIMPPLLFLKNILIGANF